MKNIRIIVLPLLAALPAPCLATVPVASEALTSDRITQSFDLSAPFKPAPVAIAGKRILRYEFHLTSFTAVPLTLVRIEVLESGSNRLLASLEGATLASAMRQVAAGGDAATENLVQPGQRSVAYIDLDLGDQPPPSALRHRVTFVKRNETFTVEGGMVELDPTPLPRLGPPLSGGQWTAVYLPDMDGGHRRFIYAIDGRARIPGRFAIDWMAAPGNLVTGAEVLAVADAEVAAIHDGVPQPVDGARVEPVSATDEAGNYIVLALPDGRYVHYQHMMPGLQVRLGERVRLGQRLGRVGSTGQVTAPHLHLHVSDGPSLLGSEGLPFKLTEGTVIGSYPSLEAADRIGEWQPVTPCQLGKKDCELPPPLGVVSFDQ